MPLKEKSLSGGEEKHEIGGQKGLYRYSGRKADTVGIFSRKQERKQARKQAKRSV